MSQQKMEQPHYQQKLPYDLKRANKEVYLVVRFRRESLEKIRTSCCKQIKVIEGYHGRVLGLSDDVKVYEDTASRWPSDRAMMLLQFDTEREAQLWLDSDNKFKNKDFPNPSDTLEIFRIPTRYIVQQEKDYLTICMEEMANIKDPRAMNEDYINPVAKCMDTFGVAHGCCFAPEGATGVRSSYLKKDSLIVLHRLKSKEHFENLYYSKPLEDLKKKKQTLCDSNVVVFQLNPDLKKSYAS
ncbi:hypothetical protein FSP39_002730 [Pinctada imbricata]|uniref:Uncharacterized protein n=1 Tax=Pinctada imbricata TaxID=66713 RepID=A0AA88XHH4_PINIB|nr:hypothetical protein FSP39_002730 [Pinctada imbricata]